MNILHISGIILMMMVICDGRVYEKCELARDLRDNFIPFDKIGIYVCIAERLSNLNTAAVGEGSFFGMFQLSSEFWCERNYAGKACDVQCSSLVDDDITDDLRCVQVIYDEHQRLFNNGFNAWPSAQDCQSQGNLLVQDCFEEENQIIETYKPVTAVYRKEKVSGNIGEGRVYERCELARELHYQHEVAMKDVATWVCIAKYESGFNTSAIGRLNWDGSEDHGLFQISDIYWCGEDGKSCGVQCEDLRDNDISNDIKCIKQIHAEHTRLSGDGFTAWAVYPRCKGQSAQFVQGCFDGSDNEIMPFKPQPGIQQPPKTYVKTSPQRKTEQKNVETGKIYERCELAQELRYKHKIPMEQVATWVCIANHESSFNTSAIGRLNADGSEDHGLFQISDIYWCSPPGTGTGCDLACSSLEDNDISDDVKCMLKIFDEHLILSGDGFNAWAVYRPHCQGKSSSFIKDCFSDNENGKSGPRPAVTAPPAAGRTVKYEPPKTSKTTKYQQPVTFKTTNYSPSTVKTTTSATKTTRTTTLAPVTKKPITSAAKTTKLSTVKSTTLAPKTTTTTTLAPATKTTNSPYKPTTFTPKTVKTAMIDTTINYSKTTQKPTTKKIEKSPEKSSTTAKPFSLFDLYFNSFPKGSSNNNEIKPQQRNLVSSTTTKKTIKMSSTAKTTTPARISDRGVKLSNEINRQKTTGGKPTAINFNNLSVATSKKPFVQATTQRSTQKTTTVLQTKIETPPTAKPFNVFDFYLKGFTSKAPIKYKPIQFSDRSTVIIKKAADEEAESRRSTVASSFNSVNTKPRLELKIATPTTTVRSISIYNAYDDFSVNSNRIGRVVQLTPHSIDYLLKLTTPRTVNRRS